MPDRSALAFPAAIGLSAFLLFAVEPYVGRLALPGFGGAPAAWATVLVAFQVALLVGYAYAHLSVTRLGVRRGSTLHLVVLGAALVVFAMGPSRFGEARLPELPPALDLLRLLAVTVGLPAIALAGTTPLASAWLAALRRPRGEATLGDATLGGATVGDAVPREAALGDGFRRDPYRLYAVSNAGSLVAVVAYPFVVEPVLGLGAQRIAFGLGLAALLALFVTVAVVVRRHASGPAPLVGTGAARVDAGTESAATPSTMAGWAPSETLDADGRPTARDVGRWMLLAAVPAGLLAAVTNLVATDLISAPLLWMGPLGIYLVTLVVAFGGRGPAIAGRLARGVPIAVVLLLVPYAAPTDWPVVPVLAVEYGGFALVALVLHGGLAGARPAPARLTTFYLAVAAGGALGGAFVALVAPVLFDGIWEYPILLVAALVAMAVTPELRATAAWPIRRRRPPSRILDLAPATAGWGRRLFVYLLLAGTLAVVLTLARSVSLAEASTWFLIGAAMLVFAGDVRAFAIVVAAVMAIAVATPPPAAFRDRSFFGVVEVLRPEGTGLTVLRHGTTIHGLQAMAADRQREPLGYYTRQGPIGDVMTRLDARTGDRSRRIVVTGLGAGTLAAWARPGDQLTFFEIDPLIERVASDPALFSYLADAGPAAGVVVGDGRLQVGRLPAASVDLLVLDAFSSDTVPIHLLTAEALADARRVIAPGGLLVVNVSSRSYELAPAVAAGLSPTGVTVLERIHQPSTEAAGEGVTTSDWLVATADPSDVDWFRARGWNLVSPAPEPLTDDRSDLLRLLRPGSVW